MVFFGGMLSETVFLGILFGIFECCFGYIFYILSILRVCIFIVLVFFGTFLESCKHIPVIII